MPVLELTREEAQLVECALRAYEDTLLFEIAKTDSRSFRDALRHRESIVHAVLQRVRDEAAEPALKS